MFKPQDIPRVYGVPIGVDFAQCLVDGLRHKSKSMSPDILARTHLIVNTRRMARRITELFCDGGASFLPQIHVLTDLPDLWGPADLPVTGSTLHQRLKLVQLINHLLDKEPDLAPRSAVFDLADSLASLLDEMTGEGISPDVLSKLDLSEHAAHWDRQNRFLSIIAEYAQKIGLGDAEARQRRTVEHLCNHWSASPPDTTIILAGSTGSRGSTHLLMNAIAKLPNGCVVLPGLDYNLPQEVWDRFDEVSEDHPQHRHYQFLNSTQLDPTTIPVWFDQPPKNTARNALISLALRPAPVTDQWLDDAPKLDDLTGAVENITWLNAPIQRQEAMAIALRLRKAAHDNQTCALITPDRVLTRQVSAQLSRWNIIPDDSAGTPLQLTSAGQYLRQICEMLITPLTSEMLIAFLKHPFTHLAVERGQHLLFTRELELHLRKRAVFFPDNSVLTDWLEDQKHAATPAWIKWLEEHILKWFSPDKQSLQEYYERLISALNNGYSGSNATLVDFSSVGDGQILSSLLQELSQAISYQDTLTPREFGELIIKMINDQEPQRLDVQAHPYIRIWGTLEARVQGADLVILAGLNEGTWPKLPAADPWLNRNLRKQAGLLLPERQIGLSAHDFQQAASASEIWLTRSHRDGSGETVMSRWLSRLQNLLLGTKPHTDQDLYIQMTSRGQYWLNLAAEFEKPEPLPRYKRPAPCPIVAARPKQLSVTEIERLIRDPYAVYAKHVLGLRPLDPLMRGPDALVRGITLHKFLEVYLPKTVKKPDHLSAASFNADAKAYLEEHIPWPSQRRLWAAMIAKNAEKFISDEIMRQTYGTPTLYEAKGQVDLPNLNFTLTAKADRIDFNSSGDVLIYDYKTGQPPNKNEQTYFNKQLLLEAMIAEESGFEKLPPSSVLRATYISLTGLKSETDAPLGDEPIIKIYAELSKLIEAYLNVNQPYLSRRAVKFVNAQNDYDHLARFGEWAETDPAEKIMLGM